MPTWALIQDAPTRLSLADKILQMVTGRIGPCCMMGANGSFTTGICQSVVGTSKFPVCPSHLEAKSWISLIKIMAINLNKIMILTWNLHLFKQMFTLLSLFHAVESGCQILCTEMVSLLFHIWVRTYICTMSPLPFQSYVAVLQSNPSTQLHRNCVIDNK